MAKLTARARKAIPSRDFAGPDRSYPIEDKSHARNALSRVSQNGSPALKAKVRAAVHRKYPSIGEKSVSKSKSHHSPTEGMQSRGHYETHQRESDRADLSHSEFQKMDHGGKHDHMVGRTTKKFEQCGFARLGFLVALLAFAATVAFAVTPASGPYGVFGGPSTFAQLPGNIPLTFSAAPTSTSGTLAFPWPSTVTSELVVFSDGEVRTVTFTNASTSVSWSGSLLGTPTVNATVDGYTTPPGSGTAGYTSDFGEVLSTGTYWTWSGFQDSTPVAPVAALITGCGTVTAVKGGATAGTFAAGATSCTPVIALPYSANGWYCSAWDITTNTDTLKQSADSTTSCTMTGTVVSADVIVWQARGF